MYRINMNYLPIKESQGLKQNLNKLNKQPTDKGTSFKDILHKQINFNDDLKFSKHALQRLEERKIDLTAQEIEKLNRALKQAEGKGIKETLIIMNNKAFIASVPNKTVITAATGNQLKDNVFTNIDGAIFV